MNLIKNYFLYKLHIFYIMHNYICNKCSDRSMGSKNLNLCQTKYQTDRPTDRRTWGFIGKFNFQYKPILWYFAYDYCQYFFAFILNRFLFPKQRKPELENFIWIQEQFVLAVKVILEPVSQAAKVLMPISLLLIERLCQNSTVTQIVGEDDRQICTYRYNT